MTCTKSYARQKVKKKDDQVYSIKEVLNKLKEAIKNVPQNKKNNIEENQKIINIVERILYFNEVEQHEGSGLKILTPNQMLSLVEYQFL